MAVRACLAAAFLVADAKAFAPVPAQRRARAISRCPPLADYTPHLPPIGIGDGDWLSDAYYYKPGEKPKNKSNNDLWRDAVSRKQRTMSAKTESSGLSEAARQKLEARRQEREQAVFRANEARQPRGLTGRLFGLFGRMKLRRR